MKKTTWLKRWWGLSLDAAPATALPEDVRARLPAARAEPAELDELRSLLEERSFSLLEERERNMTLEAELARATFEAHQIGAELAEALRQLSTMEAQRDAERDKVQGLERSLALAEQQSQLRGAELARVRQMERTERDSREALEWELAALRPTERERAGHMTGSAAAPPAAPQPERAEVEVGRGSIARETQVERAVPGDEHLLQLACLSALALDVCSGETSHLALEIAFARARHDAESSPLGGTSGEPGSALEWVCRHVEALGLAAPLHLERGVQTESETLWGRFAVPAAIPSSDALPYARWLAGYALGCLSRLGLEHGLDSLTGGPVQFEMVTRPR